MVEKDKIVKIWSFLLKYLPKISYIFEGRLDTTFLQLSLEWVANLEGYKSPYRKIAYAIKLIIWFMMYKREENYSIEFCVRICRSFWI